MRGVGQIKWFINTGFVLQIVILINLVSTEPGYAQSMHQLYVLKGEVLVLTTGRTITEGNGIALSRQDQIRAGKYTEAVIACDEVQLVPVAVRIDVKTVCGNRVSATGRGIIPEWVWNLVRNAYSQYETGTTLAGTKGGPSDKQSLRIIAPSTDTRVLTSRPWFAWTPAGDYQIAVLQGSQLIWRIDTHNSAKLDYPDGYEALPLRSETQDTEYTWEITAADGKNFASTNFYILAPAATSRINRQINEMRSNLERAGIRGKNKDLALAGFLQGEGLQAEALKLLEGALSRHPGDAELKLALRYVSGFH